jgi:hypothetical protein
VHQYFELDKKIEKKIYDESLNIVNDFEHASPDLFLSILVRF